MTDVRTLTRCGIVLAYSISRRCGVTSAGEQAFRLIRAIVPETPTGDRNSLFIVGDAHQRMSARRASMSACGIEVRGRSRRLRLNYRTTQEIRAWAVSVREGVSVDDLDEGTDTLKGYVSLLQGAAPDLVPCASEAEELSGDCQVLDEVRLTA